MTIYARAAAPPVRGPGAVRRVGRRDRAAGDLARPRPRLPAAGRRRARHRRDGAELPRAPRLLRSARDRVRRAPGAVDRARPQSARGRPAAVADRRAAVLLRRRSSVSSSRARRRGSASAPERSRASTRAAPTTWTSSASRRGCRISPACPERLHIPRLEQPRVKTPPGSVSIGGMQCCIYSVESPGGFWVLGRTPVPLYDPSAADPILLRAGDHVRFRAIDRAEFDAIAAAVAAGDYPPASSRTPSPAPDGGGALLRPQARGRQLRPPREGAQLGPHHALRHHLRAREGAEAAVRGGDDARAVAHRVDRLRRSGRPRPRDARRSWSSCRSRRAGAACRRAAGCRFSTGTRAGAAGWRAAATARRPARGRASGRIASSGTSWVWGPS